MLLAVWADVGEHMRHHLDSFTLKDMVLRGKGRRFAAFAIGLTKAVPGRRVPTGGLERLSGQTRRRGPDSRWYW